MITTGGNDFSLPYDFDGIEAENVTVDIIEPPKIDLEKNQPRDVKTQKQDETKEIAPKTGCNCSFSKTCCWRWTWISFLCIAFLVCLFFATFYALVVHNI